LYPAWSQWRLVQAAVGNITMLAQVDGIYPWPYDGPWTPAGAALIVVDMQGDFLEPDGWLALTGADIGPLDAVVPLAKRVLQAARGAELFTVFTVEAHRSDLSDLPDNKLWRSRRLGQEGPLGRHLVRGGRGAEIVPALAPREGEPVIAKPGKSAFIGTDLDQLLRRRGVRNLVFAGITTDGAVQCTLRDANDRGYECLILVDATASDVPAHHADQIHTLSLAGGHYGSLATADQFISVLSAEALS